MKTHVFWNTGLHLHDNHLGGAVKMRLLMSQVCWIQISGRREQKSVFLAKLPWWVCCNWSLRTTSLASHPPPAVSAPVCLSRSRASPCCLSLMAMPERWGWCEDLLIVPVWLWFAPTSCDGSQVSLWGDYPFPPFNSRHQTGAHVFAHLGVANQHSPSLCPSPSSWLVWW